MLIVYLFFLGFISMILRAIGLIQCLEIQCLILSVQFQTCSSHTTESGQYNTCLFFDAQLS